MIVKNRDTLVVVGLGEVLWDVFSDGEVFGGAPANFACHAAGYGCEVYMVSAVGKDELGSKAITSLESKRVLTGHIQRVSLETGRVNVKINGDGQPEYEILSDVAWDRLGWDSELQALAEKCDAACFGTLGQRDVESRNTIRRFLRYTQDSCLRVFDVNLRQNYYDAALILESLGLANVLKLNDEELEVVCKAAGIEETATRERVRKLVAKFDLKLLILTEGSRGSLLFSDGAYSHHVPQESIDVRDTVGAGDAFAATAVYGFLSGWPLDKVNSFASKAAGFVCTQAGATPSLPENLIQMMHSTVNNGDENLQPSMSGLNGTRLQPHFDRRESSERRI